MQLDIFGLTKQLFKFSEDYEIKLFEAFAGIGCQRMAFDRLGVKYKSVGISEIDKYALKSYEAIHGDCHNFGSITEIRGEHLPQIDVFTYSFPCTDLSKAGKQKGLDNTRSGLVYEVLRILAELKDNVNLPKILIMENVVDLIQTKFIREFNEIQLELEKLGYSNYTETLNAKHYGVAQNRDRVFMVSILGDYYYEFPKSIPLEKRLKDYLEENVDEKYYLSDKQLESMLNPKFESMGIDRVNEIDGVCNTILTMCGGNRDPKVMVVGKINSSQDGVVVDPCGIAPTHTAGHGNMPKVKVVGNCNPSGKGMNGNVWQGDIVPTITTNKGEGIKFIEPSIIQKPRGFNDGGSFEMSPAITSCSWQQNNLLAEPLICASRGRNPENPTSRKSGEPTKQMIEVNESGVCNTLTTVQKDNYVLEPIGVAVHPFSKSKEFNGYKDKECPALLATDYKAPKTVLFNNHRIRKLTPRECWRLMDIQDEWFDLAAEVCSASQLYKQAGNGIVVAVMAAIVGKLVDE